MKTKRTHRFAVLIGIGAGLSGGCGRAGSSSREADGSPVSPVAEIGVPECDEYVAKVHRCIADHVPAETKSVLEEHLARSRTAWTTLAANPGARPALGQSCRLALDNVRVQMKAFSCDW